MYSTHVGGATLKDVGLTTSTLTAFFFVMSELHRIIVGSNQYYTADKKKTK